MPSWFARNTPTLDPSDPAAAPLTAYKEGRKDERRQVDAAIPDRRLAKAESNETYDRGRRDERSRRRGSPFGALLLVILVAVVAGAVFIVVHYGSFAAGGQALDTTLSSTSHQAAAPVHNAADKAGDALENAGHDLKQNAGSGAG